MDSRYENPSINDGGSQYGAVTLFQPAAQVNLRKKKLKHKLQVRSDCLDFAQFMGGKFLSISAGLFCFVAFFFTALPAVISLGAKALFKPEPITVGSTVITGDTRAEQLILQRDINLLWSALAFSVAAVLCMILYCALSSCNERFRGKKINMQELLVQLSAVPTLKPEAEPPLVEQAMQLLAAIEAHLSPELASDVESETMAIAHHSFRS